MWVRNESWPGKTSRRDTVRRYRCAVVLLHLNVPLTAIFVLLKHATCCMQHYGSSSQTISIRLPTSRRLCIFMWTLQYRHPVGDLIFNREMAQWRDTPDCSQPISITHTHTYAITKRTLTTPAALSLLGGGGGARLTKGCIFLNFANIRVASSLRSPTADVCCRETYFGGGKNIYFPVS